MIRPPRPGVDLAKSRVDIDVDVHVVVDLDVDECQTSV